MWLIALTPSRMMLLLLIARWSIAAWGVTVPHSVRAQDQGLETVENLGHLAHNCRLGPVANPLFHRIGAGSRFGCCEWGGLHSVNTGDCLDEGRYWFNAVMKQNSGFERNRLWR